MGQGIVVAGHEKTAAAAVEILKQGGNAFDAIVAGGFAACVAESVLASLGGGGYLLAHSAQGLERVYDFFVQTPLKIPNPSDLDFYPIHADFGPTTQEFHIGLGSMATPGAVAGFFSIHNDLGQLPIVEVMAPAIRLCREGVPINPFQEYLFAVVEPIYAATPESRKIFGSKKFPQKLVQAGERLCFPDMANTLEALASEGAALFYHGELAKRLVDLCQNHGGILGLDDLSQYTVQKRKPLAFKYRGNRLLTNPPPSCGGILITFALELLEAATTEDITFGSAEDLCRLAHAMGLTNKARLDALSQHPEWEDACRSLLDPEFLALYQKAIPELPQALRGTTHLNVVDGQGNIASMSLSNGEGCGRILPDTGIMLNNMLGEEDINPKGFHRWKTNQRMTSMMSPTVLFQSDGAMVALGSGGSNRIRTAIVQVLRNIIDHRMSLEAAVNAARIHFERELLSVEPGFGQDVIKVLQRVFPNHQLWKEKNLFFGGVHGVASHPQEGFSAVGDPRRHGVVKLA